MWRFSPAGMQYSREPDKLPRVIEEIDRKVERFFCGRCVCLSPVFSDKRTGKIPPALLNPAPPSILPTDMHARLERKEVFFFFFPF